MNRPCDHTAADSGPRSNWLERVRDNSWIGFLGLFLFLGTVVGYFIFGSTIRSLRYLPVEGRVLESGMEPCDSNGFMEQIRFAYFVDGREYRDGRLRIDWGKFCDREEAIQAILKNYPAGQQVQGWYDPQNPSLAVIDRSPGQLQWIFAGVLCGFGAILMIAWMFHRSEQNRRNRPQKRSS